MYNCIFILKPTNTAKVRGVYTWVVNAGAGYVIVGSRLRSVVCSYVKIITFTREQRVEARNSGHSLISRRRKRDLYGFISNEYLNRVCVKI